MPEVYYPRLRPGDYDTFRGAKTLQLPDSYNEWFDFSRQQMREIIVSGVEVLEIEVYPDEFAEFCHATQSPRTLDALKEFANLKGRGKDDRKFPS